MAILVAMLGACTQAEPMRERAEQGNSALRRAEVTLPIASALPSSRARGGPSAALGAPSASTSQQSQQSQTSLAARYLWLADPDCKGPTAVDTLDARFAPPAGFVRVPVEAGAFGAFTRGLPLAAVGTDVRSYRGELLVAASDARVAAVVALDVGSADLQQCADSILRLHAEWLWSLGRADMSYRAASGTQLPFARFLAGDRIVADGPSISLQRRAKATGATHQALRRYLDDVFGWANTGSLSKQGRPIAFADVQPGDFVVAAGSPGHAVLLLDVARAPDGRRVALLGQGYMPAQNFHVLRYDATSVWFPLDEASGELRTPFWKPFPWSTLRRLEAP